MQGIMPACDALPWILALIEDFGPKRCMFGSHLPIVVERRQPFNIDIRQLVARPASSDPV
jgi:hypothetical protein